MGRNTKGTHHRNFNPPSPHGAENFKTKHFLYQHFFFLRTNIGLEAYSYFHYDLHIFSLQENLNVLLTSFYSHIIRKHTKKCFDWTCTQDTTGSNLSSCPYSQEWWVSVMYLLKHCSHWPCGQLLIRTDNGVC